MRVDWAGVFTMIVIIFWVGTCAVNMQLERDCMLQCTREIHECERTCGKL
jgi:hypothetical protein